MSVSIGLDFDEALFPWYDLAHEASVRAGIVPEGVSPTTWAPHEAYGVTLEEWVAVLDAEVLKDDGMYHTLIDPDVVHQVKRMYNRGYDIHIITARGQFGELGDRVKQITKSCIIRSGLPYTTLNFAKNKVPIAQALGIDYFLDDAPHNFDPLVEAGINAFLLDERWNRDHPEIFRPEGRRVHSLKEFCDMVMDRELRPHDLTPQQRAHVRVQ